MLCKGTGLLHRPKEVDYFVLPKELQEVFGDQAKELPIMFPVENIEVFFQQWYKCYGFNVLRCKGDGANAMTWDEEKGGMKSITCPCEKLDTGTCRRVAILQFLLPDVKGAGVWQISTTSRNSIIDINSSVDYIRGLCGRVRMIPLVLKREEIKTQRLEKGVPKSGRHYTLKIDVANVSLRELQAAGRIRPEEMMLPMPDEEREDLLYPVAGFNGQAPEEETKDEAPIADRTTQPPPLRDATLDALVNELNSIMSQFKDFGGKLTQGEKEALTTLETAEDFKQAIHKWGPKRNALQAAKEGKKTKEDRADTGEELGINRDGKAMEEVPQNLFEREENRK